MEHIASQVLWADEAIASTGSVESPVIDLSNVGPILTPYAVALKVISASGTADVKLQVHSSEDGTNFSHYDDHPNVIDSTLLSRPAGPELWNEYPITDILNKYVQLKATGIASNPADALISAKFLMRELI